MGNSIFKKNHYWTYLSTSRQNVLTHVWYASANLYKKTLIFYLMLFRQMNSLRIQKSFRRFKYTKCSLKHIKCWFVLHLQNGVSFIWIPLAILFQRITSKAAITRCYFSSDFKLSSPSTCRSIEDDCWGHTIHDTIYQSTV